MHFGWEISQKKHPAIRSPKLHWLCQTQTAASAFFTYGSFPLLYFIALGLPDLWTCASPAHCPTWHELTGQSEKTIPCKLSGLRYNYTPSTVQGGEARRIAQTRDFGNLSTVQRDEACLLSPVPAALPPAFVYNFFSHSVPGWDISNRGTRCSESHLSS